MKKTEWVWIAIAAGLALWWWKKGDCAECGQSPHAVGKDRAQNTNGLDVYL